MNGVYVRPHPAPLPQEREKYSPALCETMAAGCRTRTGRNRKNEPIATGTCKFSSAARWLSLSPGERVGVRAGVHPNLLAPSANERDSAHLAAAD